MLEVQATTDNSKDAYGGSAGLGGIGSNPYGANAPIEHQQESEPEEEFCSD